MKPKTEEELEAERLAAEAAAAEAAAAEEEKNNGTGTQRSKYSKSSKLIGHNPDDPMGVLEGGIEEEQAMNESDGNINVNGAIGEEEKQ